jgi:predicted phage-related endonuclease
MSELSPERVGQITASRIKDVLAEGKGVSRAKYAAELAASRMTGKSHRSSFGGAAIDHGNEFESVARMMYEIRNGVMVEGTGKEYYPHPQIARSGCSPDGIVSDDLLVEFKAPDTHTFIGYKLSGEIPRVYRLQMTWQCSVMRRKWCDFVAYDPDLPEDDGYIQIRFTPTPEEIEKMEFEVIKFDLEVESLIEQIKAKRPNQ